MTDNGRPATNETVRWKSRQGRFALIATILGSGLAFLDGSVVSVALPRIEADLGGGFSTLQWVLNGYLLTLGALVLVGGSLGDLLGKRRVFIWGTAAFGISSLLCGLAPTATALIGARMLQGAAAALMIPTSLAILNAVFDGEERGRAIGAWSGLAGVFTAVGPFIGGLLVETGEYGWRWIFLLNLPLVVGAIVFARIGVPQLPGRRASGPLLAQIDIVGAVLATVGLGLIVTPLIEVQRLGPVLTVALVTVGVAMMVTFCWIELRRERTQRPPPMINLSMFRMRTFTVANVVTFAVYGALGGAFFLVTVALQVGLGYSPVAAGLSGIPVTIMLALLSSKVGSLVPKIGARPLLSVGPIIMAVGMIILGTVQPGQSYWTSVFLGYVVFAAGLVLVVAPVTTTALADVGADQSGMASGINNALARIAGLLAVTLLPLVGGLSASQASGLTSGEAFLSGYRAAMYFAAAACVVGGLVALVGFKSSDAIERSSPAANRC